MQASLRFSVAALVLVAACEDGPKQIFTPNTGDPAKQNGIGTTTPWVPEGSKGYGDQSGGDSIGRARFCDEVQAANQIQEMVVAPILPDTSAGKVPLWSADGKPLHADDLLGRPEDGKLCDPTEVYSNAFTYGPTQEIIVFFNQDTRLVEGVMAYQEYLGALEGTYTKNGRKVPVVIKPRERLKIDGVELDQYTSRADQASKHGAWLNFENVSAVYQMLRETFFNAPPFPDGYDCIAEKTCEVIYTGTNETTPQDTFIVAQDTGIQVRFTPDGHIIFVYAEPVRAAPFEASSTIAFGTSSGTEMHFKFESTSRTSCSIALDDAPTFATFKSHCVDSGDTRTLSRASYQVDDARDGVQLAFNGIDLSFLHDTTRKAVLKDGESPSDDDVLYSVGFTRALGAVVSEFRPRTIGTLYKQKLEERLLNAVSTTGSIPQDQHPIALYSVAVPFLFDTPQAIGALTTSNGNQNWVLGITNDIFALYHSLTPEEQAMVDPRVLDPVFLVEPFVDAVLEAFSHGESNAPETFKIFRTTDDKLWCIGYAHFRRGGVAHRLQVQYSMDYAGVSAVFVERGESEIDRIFAGVNTALTQDATPYYGIDLSTNPGNPYGLGGAGIAITGFDRQLTTLTATLTALAPDGTPSSVALVVPGDPIEDRNGYLRQINGQRYEFVPANVVRLYGKESSFLFYVEADGAIGRIEQNRFKGSMSLCGGLTIRYGDDVRARVEEWSKTVPRDTYTACNIVYDLSANGNVLDTVVSLANRVGFTVVNGRAVAALMWR